MRLFFLGPRIFGMRPGVSVNPRPFMGSGNKIEGSFLYVIGSSDGYIKIGVTTNPRGRLTALQTGSPRPISFKYIAATPGTGFDIEEHAHALMGGFRVAGEWFDCAWGTGVLAIKSAASGLSRPLLEVSLEQVDSILSVAQASPPRPRWVRPIAILAFSIIVVVLTTVVQFALR